MTNEQFQRRMQFIVEQQAQFSVDIHQLKEVQAELTTKHNHLTEALTTVVGMLGQLAKTQDRTDVQLSQLTNKQAETEDRLNTLVGVVERYFSGNGSAGRVGLNLALRRGTRKNERGDRARNRWRENVISNPRTPAF